MPTYGNWKSQSIDRSGALQFLNRGTVWDYKRNGDPVWSNSGLTKVTFGNAVDASAAWRISAPYALFAPSQNARFSTANPLSSNMYSMNNFTLSFRFKVSQSSAGSTNLLTIGGGGPPLRRGVIIRQLSASTDIFFATTAGQTVVNISNPVGVWHRYLLTRDNTGNTNIYIDDVLRASGTYSIDALLSSDRMFVLSSSGAVGTASTRTYLTDFVMLRNDASTDPMLTLTGDAVYL